MLGYDTFKKIFAAKPEEHRVSSKEIAWSESSLYKASDFPKYNPDALLGRKGYAVYTTMMTDEQVKAVVRFKRDAVTSRDHFFEVSDESLSPDQKDERIRVFEEIVALMENPFSDSLNGIMSAMYNGFSITEKVKKVVTIDGKNWVGIKKLKLKPCDTFYFHTDAYGNVEKLTQKFEMREQAVDIEAFIHYVQNPDVDEHYGRSELREAYRPWFCKDMAIKFQNIHLERFAAGFMWAAPTNGKTLVAGSAEYASLQTAMINLQSASALIMPANVELNVEHPATTDVFEKAVAQHDKSIAKALLVPNLLGITEQGSTGSYSQSKTQLEAFLWTLDADATRLEAVLNTQLFTELGELNWGDGIYPRFKFKPISDERKLEVIKLWTELITAGAVQATDGDEAHIREALEMPAKVVVDDGVPDLVLNGSQLSSLILIITQVSTGTMTPESAKALIVAVFPITMEQANAMVISSPTGEPEGAPPPSKNKDDEDKDDKIKVLEETIVGKMGISISAYSRAVKRVDFSVISAKSEVLVNVYSEEVAVMNGAAVDRLVALAEELHLFTTDANPDDLRKLIYTPAEVSKIRAVISASLSEAWKLGEAHGRREMDKAKFASFAVNDLALQDIASKYFKAKSYTLAGDISTATQKKIQAIIAEGIKVSKSAAEIKKEIYRALEKDGLLDKKTVEEVLGTTTVKDTKARILTAIRTVSFEAINEARYNLFTDPDLTGFVEALEYSAILDDRTTEICSQLDGNIYGIDDEVWSSFRPPNHFNCRSILIAVLQGDTWAPSEPPTVTPQKGFGFIRKEPT